MRRALLVWIGVTCAALAGLGPRAVVAAGEDPPVEMKSTWVPPAPATPGRDVAAAGAAAALAREVGRYLTSGEPERAVAIARSRLSPDTTNAALRGILIKGYAFRDCVCLPVPPAPAAFAPAAGAAPGSPAGRWPCDASFLPRATGDSIAAVIATEERLAPNDLAGHLLAVDHEIDHGSPGGLDAAIARLDRFDAATVDARLIERLSVTRRPPQLGVLARRLHQRNPRRADCMANERVISSLNQAADFEGAIAAYDAIAPDSLCARRLEAAATTTLVAGGRHEDLWQRLRIAPPGISTGDYYGMVLLATLAAAHFDTSLALQRLDHEKVNEESYPEPARAVLAELRRLLVAPAATGGEWEDLAAAPFLAAETYRHQTFLLYSLALRRSPHLERAARAMADDLAARNIPAAAASVCEGFAGGRRPGLDRRWDPRRGEYLRKSAAYYFLAEDDAACRAVLAALDAPAPADDLLAGAAALRAGDRAAAGPLLARAAAAAPEPAMRETAERLGALAAEAGGGAR